MQVRRVHSKGSIFEAEYHLEHGRRTWKTADMISFEVRNTSQIIPISHLVVVANWIWLLVLGCDVLQSVANIIFMQFFLNKKKKKSSPKMCTKG